MSKRKCSRRRKSTWPLHLERMAAFRLSLHGITLEKWNGSRRKRRYCKGRRQFISYSKIPGAKKYVRN